MPVRRLARCLFAYLCLVVAVSVLLPALAVAQSQGFLSLSWMPAGFFTHLVAAVVLAMAFVIFHRPIYRCCFSVAGWLLRAPVDRNRWVVAGVVLMIFTSYAWQTHIGIAHRGVPGWTYAGLPQIVGDKVAVALTPSDGPDLAAFGKALRREPMPYIRRSGYASGELMFLHFRDGEMLPANLALSMVSWPRSTFGLDAEGVRHEKAFLALLRHTLARRRAGSQFLLPPAISYPPHLSYQVIDYTSYPPADQLIGVSFWNVVAEVKGDSLEIVNAKRVAGAGAF